MGGLRGEGRAKGRGGGEARGGGQGQGVEVRGMRTGRGGYRGRVLEGEGEMAYGQ